MGWAFGVGLRYDEPSWCTGCCAVCWLCRLLRWTRLPVSVGYGEGIGRGRLSTLLLSVTVAVVVALLHLWSHHSSNQSPTLSHVSHFRAASLVAELTSCAGDGCCRCDFVAAGEVNVLAHRNSTRAQHTHTCTAVERLEGEVAGT